MAENGTRGAWAAACALALAVASSSAAVDPGAFIAAACARGERTIRVPKGVYDVDPGEVASVYLKGVRDVTVDFQGSELRGRRRSGLLALRDCILSCFYFIKGRKKKLELKKEDISSIHMGYKA